MAKSGIAPATTSWRVRLVGLGLYVLAPAFAVFMASNFYYAFAYFMVAGMLFSLMEILADIRSVLRQRPIGVEQQPIDGEAVQETVASDDEYSNRV